MSFLYTSLRIPLIYTPLSNIKQEDYE
jgi:hypothetical protein